MVKLCKLWPGYVNYSLLKISSSKIKREFRYVMYYFLNKLILKRIKKFYWPKSNTSVILSKFRLVKIMNHFANFGPKNLNKTPLG